MMNTQPEPADRCVCAELGATGPGQFHTRCPYHARRAAERGELAARARRNAQAAREGDALERSHVMGDGFLQPAPSRRLRLTCPSGHTWRTTLDRTANPVPGWGLCPDCAQWGAER